MRFVEVKTQHELDEALKVPDVIPICIGNGYFTASGSATVTASGSATVTASGSATVTASGSATVTASGSATVTASGSATVTASGSATVTASGSATVTASGSATVTASGSATVTASGSATVTASGSATVTASGSATVTASGSATVTASKYVAVHSHTTKWGKPNIKGGIVIEAPIIKTAEDWCDYYGVAVKRGLAILFKSVDEDFSTDRARSVGISYAPGEKPSAPDWGGGAQECGGGLHFSPRPTAALQFNDHPNGHIVACPVRLSDIVVHPDGHYPDKVKAPRVAGAVYEVDIDGYPLS